MGGRAPHKLGAKTIAGVRSRNWNRDSDEVTEEAALGRYLWSLGEEGFHQKACKRDKANKLRIQKGSRRNHALVVVVSAKSAISSRKFPAFVA